MSYGSCFCVWVRPTHVRVHNFSVGLLLFSVGTLLPLFVLRLLKTVFQQTDFNIVNILPDWTCRGNDSYDFGRLCCRADPKTTKTNGFFVACFERIKE